MSLLLTLNILQTMVFFKYIFPTAPGHQTLIGRTSEDDSQWLVIIPAGPPR